MSARAITLYLGGHNVAHLVHDLRDAHARTNNAAIALVADAIAAKFTPKPAEPTGLGAVVEDSQGERWVRVAECDQSWRSEHAAALCDYALIDAVRVLSEGVSA